MTTPDPPRWSVAIHGGAGHIERMDQDAANVYYAALGKVLRATEAAADAAGQSLDPLELAALACAALEDAPCFNAGKGAVFNEAGGHELEASIMSGADLECGAVALATRVKNPVRVAQAILQEEGYIFLAGPAVETLAEARGLELVADNSYFDTVRRREQLERHEAAVAAGAKGWHAKGSAEASESGEAVMPRAGATGTVGAVVWVAGKGVAAATSTGGRTGKPVGRVGDTPLIGLGTYAHNESLAISGTGIGEAFMRGCTGVTASCRMRFGGLGFRDACTQTVEDDLPAGAGGVIAVCAATGEVAMPFNTSGMFRGSISVAGEGRVAIWHRELPLVLRK